MTCKDSQKTSCVCYFLIFFFMWETQTTLPIRTEAEDILFETNRLRAEKLVEDLNNGFFQDIAAWLQEGQKMTFEFADGSKQVVTPNCSHRIAEGSVDYFVDEGWRQCCSNCKRSIAKMKVFFDRTHLCAAIKAFEYAVKNNVQFVQVNDLGLTKVEYSKMNRLVKFGLAFRDKEVKIHGSNLWVYGIPRKRIYDFIRGQWSVASFFIQDPLLSEGEDWKREMSEKRITVDQVPSISKLRESLWDHLTSYEWNEQDSFE